MTDRSTEHATFEIERSYDAAPDRVFAAWSDPAAKAAWFGTPSHKLDFRIGGQELNVGGPPDGLVYTYTATYLEIVPDQRIVYAYTMDAGTTRISVSVTTVELVPNGGGTTLTFTEQGVFLDRGDTVESRRGGTEALLDQLGKALG